MKKFIFTLYILLTVGLSSVKATQEFVANFKVNHIASPFEKIIEKIKLKFKYDNNDKAEYLRYVLENRLAELVYVVSVGRVDDIETTASRYNTYQLSTINFIIQNKLVSQRDNLISDLNRHKQVIEKLQENYKFESGWWLAIQHDINSIKDGLVKLEALR